MDISQTAAAWLSVLVTTIGLGSLITQASVITDKLDPFSAMRDEHYLGPWAWLGNNLTLIHGRLRNHHRLDQPYLQSYLMDSAAIPSCTCPEYPPKTWEGLAGRFCSVSSTKKKIEITSSNRPSNSDLEMGLSPLKSRIAATKSVSGWEDRPTAALVRHGSLACTAIDRTTLITLLSITNARSVFTHADASGYRAAYVSYNGQWDIECPIGSAATIRLTPMDPVFVSNDVYPPSYERRVDHCIQMTTGVIYTPRFKCAFPGRRLSGRYILKYLPKGFTGAHGARHLYNMMGGKAYEVDYLSPWRLDEGDEDPKDALKLILPSRHEDGAVELFVPQEEQDILAKAMDLVPWSSLSWSIHRGLRDILVEFCKDRMDRHREELALLLRQAVLENPEELEAMGYNQTFVREHMADAAAGAVNAGSGKSADLVRVVTDAVLIQGIPTVEELEETLFWRTDQTALDQHAIIGLTKCFILGWSADLDYQLYHKLPTNLYFG